MAISDIPASMRARRQWVCWAVEAKDGKPTKVPKTIGGYNASSIDPADWYTFDTVCKHAHKFEGRIGYVFTADDPLCGIDLDDCFETPGELKPWAVPIVERFEGTYAEVSPSGKGLKIWCVGKSPLSRGRKEPCEDGAVELYDHARFFAVTGNVWDDSEPSDKQESLDWFAANYFRPDYELPKVNSAMPRTDDRIERAAKYLETVEPAISFSGGHNATFRAACKLVQGFDLSVDDAYNLMATIYNPKCVPPWSDKDLRRKCEQADKESGERGYLLSESPKFEHYPGVDISGILRGTPASSQDDDEKPDDEAFFGEMVPEDGLIREIYEYYNKTAFKRSNTIGDGHRSVDVPDAFWRKIRSFTNLRTNDYNIIMASTSVGKEPCRATCNEIIDAAIAHSRLNLQNPVFSGYMQSGNGLMSAIAQRKTLLWICDEFGEIIKNILDKKNGNSHSRMIAYHMLQLYGLSSGRYAGDAHSDGVRNEVNQPHLCVLGMTTGEIFDILKASDVHSGLIGRLVFWSQQDRAKRNPNHQVVGVPDLLAAKVAGWMNFQLGIGDSMPDPVLFDFDHVAKARWNRHQDTIDERMASEPELRAAVWAELQRDR